MLDVECEFVIIRNLVVYCGVYMFVVEVMEFFEDVRVMVVCFVGVEEDEIVWILNVIEVINFVVYFLLNVFFGCGGV